MRREVEDLRRDFGGFSTKMDFNTPWVLSHPRLMPNFGFGFALT